MALIPSSIGLVYNYIVLAIFNFLMVWFPQWFLAAYKIDLTTTPFTEKLVLTGLVQFIGLNYACGAGLMGITVRQGNDSTKGILCLVTGVWSLISAIITLCSYKYWTDMGVPPVGILINTGLFLVGSVLNFLGSGSSSKLAPISKPLYWGFFLSILVTTVYMFGMFFVPGALMKGYGIQFTGQSNALLIGLMRFGAAPYFIYTILTDIAQFFIEPSVTYLYARWKAIMLMVFSVVYLIGAATWTSLGIVPTYREIIRGQYVNAVLFFVFFLLFYIPIASLDGGIKGAVLGALGLKAGKEDAGNGWGSLSGADEKEDEDAETG